MRATPFLIVLVSIVLPASQTTQSSEIDFGTSLQTFSDCLVHFLLHHLEGDDKHFTVKPQEFPVVMSVHRHKRYREKEELRDWDAGLKCNNKVYWKNHTNNKFLFEPQPPGKLGCFVQIFVTPIPCSTTAPDFKGVSHYVFYFNNNGLIFHHFNYNFDEVSNSRKCCVFYIHVESGVTNAVKKQDLGRIHYISHMSDNRFFTALHNPTQLIYWIDNSQTQGFEVSHTAVVTCKYHENFRREIQQHCPDPYSKSAVFNICYKNLVAKNKWIHLVNYNWLTENRYTVNQRRLICPNKFLGHHEKNTIVEIENEYLTESITAGVDLKPVFWRMLFPNTTILGVNDERFIYYSNVNLVNSLSINPTPLGIRYESVEFITCVPITEKPFLSLAGYVSAFDVATWASIALFLFLTILIFQSIERKGKKYVCFAVTCLFYSILIGQGTSAIKRVRLLTGAWIVAGLFLTYNYQGSNIDQLIAPLEPIKLDNFEEMFRQNLTVFSMYLSFEQGQVYVEVYNGTIERWSVLFVTLAPMYERKQMDISLTEAETVLRRFIKVPVHENEILPMLYID